MMIPLVRDRIYESTNVVKVIDMVVVALEPSCVY